MAGRADQKLQVQQATDIVHLIGEHIALQRKGREMVCLCPFHDDHKPSMSVVPQKQIFHCFVCGTGGDVFAFVMKYHRMTFPEALRHLADRAGIKLEQRALPSDGESENDQPSDRQLVLEANQCASSCFTALLKHAEHGLTARKYLTARGVDDGLIETFGLGYAADRWDGLVRMIAGKGWSTSTFELAGLICGRTNGDGHYDRFRHRLIFPICDALGRPIAFGARRLREEDEPKYLNSPETVLFNKSSTLYGLHLAKRDIMAARAAVVVEGYTDVIACHQAGIGNVVATLGTALTAQHVGQLRHYADKVVLIFDADEAGRQAADRAVEAFFAGSLDVMIAVLPDGLDPADLLARPDGRAAWQASVDGATDALSYQYERVREQLGTADTISSRQRLAEDYLRRLSGMGLDRQGPIRRAMIMQHAAGLLGLDEQQVAVLLRRLAPSRPARVAAAASDSDNAQAADSQPQEGLADSETAPTMTGLRSAESQLIGVLLRQPDLFDRELFDGKPLHEVVGPTQLVNDDARRLYEHVRARLLDDEQLRLNELLADLVSRDDEALAAYATRAEAEAERRWGGSEEQLTDALRGAVARLRDHHHDRQYDQTRTLATATANLEQTESETLLRRIVDHQRSNYRPWSIGRAKRP